MQVSKYEANANGPIESMVVGENNSVVTLIYQDGKQRIVPFQAPPRPSHQIVGRESVLQDLKRRLSEKKVISLKGLPGVGKTLLAIELAHDKDLLALFEDGVLWVGLGVKVDVFSVLGSMAIALGMAPEYVAKLVNVEERAKAFSTAIGMRRLLVVADDAWTLEAALAVRPSGPNCGYLVTTRFPQIALSVAGLEAATVKELDIKDGLTLLSRLVPDVVREQPDNAKALVEAVGGLPLAVVLMGKYLQKETHSFQPQGLKEALDKLKKPDERLRLEQPQTRLDRHPSLPLHSQVSLEIVVGISYEALDHASRRALQALAILPSKPNSFSDAAALAISGQSVQALDTLVDYGLLESSGPGRYTLHQVIADFAKGKIADDDAFRRIVTFFVDYACAHENDYCALDTDINNILAALQESFRLKMNVYLMRGTNSLYNYLEVRGMYDSAEIYLGFARQIAAAMDDAKGLVTSLLNLGRIAIKRGNLAGAEMHWLEALEISRRIADQEKMSNVLMNLGGLYCRLSRSEKARETLQEGLRLAREINHQERISTLLNNLGSIPFSKNDIASAEGYWLESLEVARKCGKPITISHPLTNLGLLEYMRGNLAKAEIYLLEALDLARSVKHLEKISILLMHMGVLDYLRERFESAELNWREALDAVRRIGTPEVEYEVLNNLGMLEYDRGNLAKAEIYFQEALDIARRMGEPYAVGCLLGNVGEIATKRGNFRMAETCLLEALKLLRESGKAYGIANTLANLGQIMSRNGDFAQSKKCLLEALRLARIADYPQSIVEALGGLGELEFRRQNFDESEKYLFEALDISRKTKNCQLISATLVRWGEYHILKQKPNLALSEFREALEIGKSRKELVGFALFGIARASLEQGNIAEARHNAHESLAVFRVMGHYQAEQIQEWLSKLPRG